MTHIQQIDTLEIGFSGADWQNNGGGVLEWVLENNTRKLVPCDKFPRLIPT